MIKELSICVWFNGFPFLGSSQKKRNNPNNVIYVTLFVFYAAFWLDFGFFRPFIVFSVSFLFTFNIHCVIHFINGILSFLSFRHTFSDPSIIVTHKVFRTTLLQNKNQNKTRSEMHSSGKQHLKIASIAYAKLTARVFI